MDDNHFLTLFQRYKRPIFLGVALLVLTTVLTIRWVSGRQGSIERDFSYARELASEMGSNIRGIAVADIEGIVQRHRELQPQYDGRLAQYWIKGRSPEMAAPYMDRIALRTAKNAPLYTQFTQGSLLIAEGKSEEALEQTEILKTLVSEKTSPLLSACVTLRCALLQEELGRPEAKASWQELIVTLETHPKETKAIQTALRDGKVSLMDYAKSKL